VRRRRFQKWGTVPETTKALVRDKASILSPLRYPGSKRRLASYIAETLRLNGLKPKLFVEPFAGGASVGLVLLNNGFVERLALGERDPLVASFWKVVFNDSEWLINEINNARITVRNWRRFREGRFHSDRERALACLFLNRTSFSGILAHSAGPIGGYEQRSEYKIDCRFAPDTIARRIRQAAALTDKVEFVRQADWKQTLKFVNSLDYKSNEVFIYLDPPFFQRADRLYRFYFSPEDHRDLREVTRRLRQKWLLSYDPADTILKLYADHHAAPEMIDLLYSVNQSLVRAQEIIITNLKSLPSETRLWRSSAEWKKYRAVNGTTLSSLTVQAI
jgi:DNA adenine methylase